MPVTDRFEQVSSTVARSNRGLHQRALHNLFQLVPSCGLNTKRELIYTQGVNNNIQSIIRSVELKTPIVSPMDCVDSPWASYTTLVHLAAFNPMKGSFFFPIYLVHSWFLCGQCCTHSCLPRSVRVPHIADRHTGRRERHTRCPSSHCSTDSAPWCTGRYRCTELDRRLRGDTVRFHSQSVKCHSRYMSA